MARTTSNRRATKKILRYFSDFIPQRAGTAFASWCAGPNSLGSNVMRTLHRAFAAAVAALALCCTATASVADGPYRVSATSRIKDLANIEGVRQNQLIGYGLGGGVQRTRETPHKGPLPKQKLPPTLERPRR